MDSVSAKPVTPDHVNRNRRKPVVIRHRASCPLSNPPRHKERRSHRRSESSSCSTASSAESIPADPSQIYIPSKQPFVVPDHPYIPPNVAQYIQASTVFTVPVDHPKRNITESGGSRLYDHQEYKDSSARGNSNRANSPPHYTQEELAAFWHQQQNIGSNYTPQPEVEIQMSEKANNTNYRPMIHYEYKDSSARGNSHRENPPPIHTQEELAAIWHQQQNKGSNYTPQPEVEIQMSEKANNTNYRPMNHYEEISTPNYTQTNCEAVSRGLQQANYHDGYQSPGLFQDGYQSPGSFQDGYQSSSLFRVSASAYQRLLMNQQQQLAHQNEIATQELLALQQEMASPAKELAKPTSVVGVQNWEMASVDDPSIIMSRAPSGLFLPDFRSRSRARKKRYGCCDRH